MFNVDRLSWSAKSDPGVYKWGPFYRPCSSSSQKCNIYPCRNCHFLPLNSREMSLKTSKDNQKHGLPVSRLAALGEGHGSYGGILANVTSGISMNAPTGISEPESSVGLLHHGVPSSSS